MLEHLLHIAAHHAVEAFEKSDLKKKVDDGLDKGVTAISKKIKDTGKVAKRGLNATMVGVKSGINEFKNNK